MKTTICFLAISVLFGLFSCNRDTKIQKRKPKDFIESTKNSLKNLHENDTVFVHFKTYGCEHHYSERLKIYRTADGFQASLQLILPNKETESYPIQSVLKDSGIKMFDKFEYAIEYPKGSMMSCTNHEEYMLIKKTDTICYKNSSCSFQEYDKLKKSMFGEKKLRTYSNSVHNQK